LVYSKSKKSGLGKPPFIPKPDSFEFPTAPRHKKKPPLVELTAKQQACFNGFEWVPGGTLPTVETYKDHFSISVSALDPTRASTTQACPTSPKSIVVTGSSREPLPAPGAEDEEKLRTAASCLERSSTSRTTLRPPTVDGVDSPRTGRRNRGAISPRGSGHRMKLKHLRDVNPFTRGRPTPEPEPETKIASLTVSREPTFDF